MPQIYLSIRKRSLIFIKCKYTNIYTFISVSTINDTCFFNEQCEAFHFQTECRDGRCICRFEMSPTINKDGTIECKGITRLFKIRPNFNLKKKCNEISIKKSTKMY